MKEREFLLAPGSRYLYKDERTEDDTTIKTFYVLPPKEDYILPPTYAEYIALPRNAGILLEENETSRKALRNITGR